MGDKILKHDTQKVSAARVAPTFLDSEYYENNIYQVERMSLKETKENLNEVIVNLNANRKFHMGLKIKIYDSYT